MVCNTRQHMLLQLVSHGHCQWQCITVLHTGTFSNITCIAIQQTQLNSMDRSCAWFQLYFHVLWLKMCLFVAVHFYSNKLPASCKISDHRTRHTTSCPCVSTVPLQEIYMPNPNFPFKFKLQKFNRLSQSQAKIPNFLI